MALTYNDTEQDGQAIELVVSGVDRDRLVNEAKKLTTHRLLVYLVNPEKNRVSIGGLGINVHSLAVSGSAIAANVIPRSALVMISQFPDPNHNIVDYVLVKCLRVFNNIVLLSGGDEALQTKLLNAVDAVFKMFADDIYMHIMTIQNCGETPLETLDRVKATLQSFFAGAERRIKCILATYASSMMIKKQNDAIQVAHNAADA